jgi:hypothetical protein
MVDCSVRVFVMLIVVTVLVMVVVGLLSFSST